MSVPTVGQMAAAIQRRCKGKIPFLEILDAIDEKNKEIHGHYEWPWTKAEYNIPLKGPYTTGTISVTDGTAIVTGVGTTWDTSWAYKRIVFGGSGIDYPISAVNSTTQLTLASVVNLGANLSAEEYTIFQDVYPMPDDCETILAIVNPLYQYRLHYLPTYTLQSMYVFPRTFFTNLQYGFCDGAYDDTNQRSTIQFAPPPGSVSEYRLIYRRRPPTLGTLSAKPIVPETYYRAIELLAEYQVRLDNQMVGWNEAKMEGYQVVKSMLRKYTAAPMYDTYASFPLYDRSQVNGGGPLLTGPTSP